MSPLDVRPLPSVGKNDPGRDYVGTSRYGYGAHFKIRSRAREVFIVERSSIYCSSLYEFYLIGTQYSEYRSYLSFRFAGYTATFFFFFGFFPEGEQTPNIIYACNGDLRDFAKYEYIITTIVRHLYRILRTYPNLIFYFL